MKRESLIRIRPALCLMLASLMFLFACKKEPESEFEPAPEGAIDGLFTVNNQGDKVYFSQGNLQYQASTNIWRFADNQWDYVGEDNQNMSSSYDGWMDLFRWGTSGYDHGAINYQPWSASQDYYGYNAYGIDYFHLWEQTGRADWGYNCISNGGNVENQWRTLTGGENGEWDYVLNLRKTKSEIRYAKAIVNDVNGVILVPDNWDNSYTFNSANTAWAKYNSNVISQDKWKDLECKGCVFLPAAGSIISHTNLVTSDGISGRYWSSSSYSIGDGFAYYMYFGDVELDAKGITDRWCGRSVRLVHDARPIQ